MKFEGKVKDFAAGLLQARLNGKLTNPKDVVAVALACQPQSGFTNVEWNEVCEFILKLEPASIIPEAKKLAEEYGLTLEY